MLFEQGVLTAITQTICWRVIFFFASAGASAAYLTVSEIFPLEMRAKAIAVFFAIAQCFGALGPVIYGAPDRRRAANRPAVRRLPAGRRGDDRGGIVAALLGVNAEGESLEDVALPLSAVGRTAGRTGSVRAEGAASPRLSE